MKKRSTFFVPVLCFFLIPGIVYADSIVFVTSNLYDGNLGGIAGADSKCQASAAAAGLSGTFRAFISGTSISASSRVIHSAYPYKLVNGTVVANDWADLADGLTSPINRDQAGNDLTNSQTVRVWTATSADLTYFGQNCSNGFSDWSGTTSRTVAGILTQTNSGWINGAGVNPCANLFRLYCFQQVTDPARISGRVLAQTGRPVTHASITISGGSLATPLVYFTNRRGEYTSAPIAAGTYSVTVAQRRFTFSPATQTITLSGTNVTNANFTAGP